MNVPRIGVGVFLIIPRKGFVWLLRHNTSHGNGEWCLPGGRLEFNETLSACAIRETFEETGIQLDDVECLGTYSEDFFPEQNMHWITHYFVGVAENNAIPVITEPNKCSDIKVSFELPKPIFSGTELAYQRNLGFLRIEYDLADLSKGHLDFILPHRLQ